MTGQKLTKMHLFFVIVTTDARLAASESEYRLFYRKRHEVFHTQDDVAPEEVQIIALREIMPSAFTRC